MQVVVQVMHAIIYSLYITYTEIWYDIWWRLAISESDDASNRNSLWLNINQISFGIYLSPISTTLGLYS